MRGPQARFCERDKAIAYDYGLTLLDIEEGKAVAKDCGYGFSGGCEVG